MSEKSFGREYSDVPKSKWTEMRDEILRCSPEIRLEYAGTIMKTKLLALKNREDRHAITFIVDVPSPDLSKRILGDRKAVEFSALYFLNGDQRSIYCRASLDSFIISNGYPAIVMSLIPPIRYRSEISITYPSREKPVKISMPLEGDLIELLASSISKKWIIGEPIDKHSAAFEMKRINGLILNLPGYGDIEFSGDVMKATDNKLVFNIDKFDDNSKYQLEGYLMEYFSNTYEMHLASALKSIAKDKNKPDSVSKKGQPLVLIVDDEAEAHFAVSVLLRESGYRVAYAANGEDGLKKARSMRPDFILLDIDMPRLGGLNVLRLIRMFPETKDIVVIMLTASANHSIVKKSTEYGISDYVSKPYDPVDVMRRINEIRKS